MLNKNDTNNTLFGILSKLSYGIKSKIIAVSVILPLVMILSTLLYGYTTIKSETDTVNMLITDIKENQTDLIIYSLLENSEKAKVQTDNAREEIVNRLYKEYNNDKVAMKKDFDSNSTDTRFYRILSETIDGEYINKNSDNNRMFIATKEGVLVDDALNYVDNSFKDWNTIIQDTPNQDLATVAVEKIRRHKVSNLILWIDNKSLSLNSIQYNNSVEYNPNGPTIAFIKELLNNNGLEELKNYNIMVVSYIFDNEDIFGIPDVSYGKRNDNDKIYIIQTFSIKDAIESNAYLKDTITSYNTLIHHYEDHYKEIANTKIVATVIFVILEAIAFFGVWYLAEFFIYFHTTGRRDKLK